MTEAPVQELSPQGAVGDSAAGGPAALGPDPARARKKRVLWAVVRWSVSLGAIAYVAQLVEWSDVTASVSRLHPVALVEGVALTTAGVLVGALRWRALLFVFGAEVVPRFTLLARLYFESLFYNTFLPGGVGGDVVRGIAARHAFGERGVTASVAVIFVERVLGLTGLLMLTAFTGLGEQIQGVTWLVPLALLSALASVLAFVGVAVGARLAPRLPGPLGRLAARLPRVERVRPLLPALVMSVLTHVLAALAGHVLVHSMAPETTLNESFAVVPLATAAGFFPFTVGGWGARETAFVYLYASLGVPKAAALATSIGLWSVQVVVALGGGVLAWVRPASLLHDKP